MIEMRKRHKQLILMRHSYAEDVGLEGTDFSRPLSRRGQKEATKTAQLIKTGGGLPQLVIHSAALRTTQTAENLMSSWNAQKMIQLFSERDLYNARPQEIIKVIQNIESLWTVENVLILAHNPGISYLAAQAAARQRPIYFQPAGYALFDVSLEHWSEFTLDACRLEQLYLG